MCIHNEAFKKKEYRPGQIVTISGKRYRIQNKKYSCASCLYVHLEPYTEQCKWCEEHLKSNPNTERYVLKEIKNENR